MGTMSTNETGFTRLSFRLQFYQTIVQTYLGRKFEQHTYATRKSGTNIIYWKSLSPQAIALVDHTFHWSTMHNGNRLATQGNL